jgi:F-type H+-transporting ATPase subunit c
MMKKIFSTVAAVATTALVATPAMAQEAAALIPAKGLATFGAMIGLGLVVMGAGKGIGMIGSHAMDAIARQPEAANDIRNNMIVSAALIEGVALIAAILCFLPMVLV